jgi:hypothetical protein
MIQVLEGTIRKGGFRLYRNTGDRRRAVTHLKKFGFNYFVGFRDSNPTHPAGLDYGQADWVGLFPYEKDIDCRAIVH